MTDRITKTVDGKTLVALCSICRKPLAWVDCDRCGGDGFIDCGDFVDSDDDEYSDTYDCPDCDGTGEDVDCIDSKCQRQTRHAVWVEIGGES